MRMPSPGAAVAVRVVVGVPVLLERSGEGGANHCASTSMSRKLGVVVVVVLVVVLLLRHLFATSMQAS